MFINSKSFHQLTSRGAQKKLLFLSNYIKFLLLQLIYHITKTCTVLVFQGNCIEKAGSFAWGLLRFFFSSLPLKKCCVWSMYLLVVRQGTCQLLHTKPCSTLMQGNGPECTKQPLGLGSQMSELAQLWQRPQSKATKGGLCFPEQLTDGSSALRGDYRPRGSCSPSSRVETGFLACRYHPGTYCASKPLPCQSLMEAAPFSWDTEPRARALRAVEAVRGQLKGWIYSCQQIAHQQWPVSSCFGSFSTTKEQYAGNSLNALEFSM